MTSGSTQDPIATMDFGDLEVLWIERARRVADFRRRVNPEGMTRPPRDPEERAWLAERGLLGPFREVTPQHPREG